MISTPFYTILANWVDTEARFVANFHKFSCFQAAIMDFLGRHYGFLKFLKFYLKVHCVSFQTSPHWPLGRSSKWRYVKNYQWCHFSYFRLTIYCPKFAILAIFRCFATPVGWYFSQILSVWLHIGRNGGECLYLDRKIQFALNRSLKPYLWHIFRSFGWFFRLFFQKCLKKGLKWGFRANFNFTV